MTSLPGEQLPSSAAPKRFEISNLTQRLLTGMVALPLVLVATYAGGWWFTALALLLASIGVMEFCMLGRARGVEGSALVGVPVAVAIVIAAHTHQPLMAVIALLLGGPAVFALQMLRDRHEPRVNLIKMLTTLAAVLYVGVPAALLVAIRDLPDGLIWLLTIFCLTWGTDTFAFIGGRLWGKRKLAPHISPKKTVEGAIVGVIGGIVPATLVLVAADKFTTSAMIPLALGPLLAILGDLVESGLKRLFQVKDSHLTGFDILPGHGGVLDRVDGLILVTVFAYAYLVSTGLAP
ncbi:MAG: phosphatidate cytidylyltransferase [Chloroflexota bacterium]